MIKYLKTPLLFCILFTMVTARSVAQNNPPADEHSFVYLSEQFGSPGKKFGSAPLWVWNTDVNENIIDTMLLQFKENKFGGVFIHPRPGLITEYLSDEWFNLVSHTLKKGKELGLQVWIYDENSYPSGFAGGHVPAQMPKSYNQGQMLHLTKTTVLPDTSDAFFICLKEEGGKFEAIEDLESLKGKSGSFYLFQKENYRKSPWYGGFSYVDLLVKGVTEKFIAVTMDGYERVMGDEFGKAVPGVFTDEPNIEVQGENNIRWTPDLFEIFQQTWGYDLRLNLPSLFEEVGDWKKVRHNYYQTLLQLFIDRWSKPWNAYTKEKGLEWTGHYWEHGWPSPNHGGDNMAMYAWHQRPAIDMLFNRYDEKSPHAQFGNIRSVKELSSVANQLNKKRTLSETYGGGGWELTFKDLKRLGDWEYVLGVNTMNQHLSFMTIKGARKYDYPQTFSYHSPWWPYYGQQNQYFARLSLALSRGEQINNILILEPTTSAWMYAAYGESHPRMEEIGLQFQAFITRLQKAQAEYDLGSENIIKDHGKVDGTSFIIGERAYTTVVIPPGMENIDSKTFELLQGYAENGGKIISFEKLQKIDGADNGRLETFYKDQPQIARPDTLNNTIIQDHFASGEITFMGTPQGNLYHHRRKLSDGQLLFLANVSLEEPSEGKIRLNGNYALLMDAKTGNIYDYPASVESGHIEIDYKLFPAGSLLLFITNRKINDFPDYEPPVTSGQNVESSETTVRRVKPNVLTIDFCDVKIGDTLLKDQNVYNATDTVFKHYGFTEGNPWNTSVQFKSNTVKRDTFPAGTGFTATYHFNIAPHVNADSLQAVVERPGLWTVLVNGTAVSPESGKWWLDKTFAVFNISDAVKTGANEIVLKADPMSVHAEIEPVYIRGDFNLAAAEKGWHIVQSKPLQLGSWKEQGMSLYGHEVAYSKKFEVNNDNRKYLVKLGDWKGTVAIIKVNGQQAGIVGYPPYVQDISRFIHTGSNEVEVLIIGSLKNTLGPHHGNPVPGEVSPWHWRRGIEKYPPGEEYDLYNYGLMEAFEIIAY